MSKIFYKVNISVLIASLFFLWTVELYAQNLPNKQTGSLRAPKDLKIDGKPTEWTQLQAYNSATELYYTIANDDDNLYLIVEAKNPDAVSKIAQGGITFSIKKEGVKEGKSLTYPVLEQAPYFNLRRKKNLEADTTAKAADSLMNHNNALIDKNFKLIKTNGFADVDTVLSVYNVSGIRVKSAFDNKKVLTCEFAVKLKLLDGSVNTATKYTYQLRLNGTKPLTLTVQKATPGSEALMNRLVEKANMHNMEQSAPTDFEGTYTLVAK